MMLVLVNSEVGREGAAEPRVFATTRWSLVLSAAKSGSGEQDARDALAELCRTYWRPIFSFVCRRAVNAWAARILLTLRCQTDTVNVNRTGKVFWREGDAG